MKTLRQLVLLFACVGIALPACAQTTNPSNPNYGTNKIGQCYNATLNNWTGISNTTANLNAYPIQCDQYGNLLLPSGTYLPLTGGTLTGVLMDASGFVGPLTGNVTGSVNGAQVLSGTTSTITGTSLTASCDSGTATVTGAIVGHPVAVSSTTGADVGGAFNLRGSVTATGTVTVYVCGTGTPSSLAYNVVVF